MPRIEAPAELDQLESLLGFVTGFLQERGVRTDRIPPVRLAVEEALVNVFNYAYPDGKGAVELRIDTQEDGDIVLEIVDWGVPFDMVSAPEPDLNEDVDHRKVGGLGLVLIRKMAKKVRYLRKDQRNKLTLIFDGRA